MPKPDHHVFICLQKRPPGHPRGSCGQKGAEAVYNMFSQELVKRNMINVALTQTGCIGPCQGGVNVLIYPSGVLYSLVNANDVDKIIDQHIIGGEIYQAKLAPKDFW